MAKTQKLDVQDNKNGIGADDRAGCAMLYLLKDSGHSLLIAEGEEQGKLGSRWLMDHNPGRKPGSLFRS